MGDESEEDEVQEILRDVYPNFIDVGENSDIFEEEPNDEAKKFYRLLRDSQ